MSAGQRKPEEAVINVTRASLPPIEEYQAMLREIWESAQLTNMGRYHEELRERLRRYLGVEELELFVNGHSALELLLQAFSLKGEVITTPFTFASTTHAIVRNGLKPVFCDISEKNYTIDVERLPEKITENTCAILPVHVYGNICAVHKLSEMGRKYHIPVIYDAAHAFGESYEGRGVGSYGDASMFSFHATKVFHTIEGGAVSLGRKDPELMEKLYELKNFGILGQEEVASVGANGKMNEFSAAMGLCNLNHISEYIEGRKRVFERYREILSGRRGILFPEPDPDTKSNYAYLPVRFLGASYSRDAIFERLGKNGIHARKYFYPCVNAYRCYREQYDERETPVAGRISREILTLPIYPGLPLEEVDQICRIVLEER